MIAIMMMVHVIIMITVVIRIVMMIIITMMILMINNGNRTFLRFTVTLGDTTSIFYLSLQDFCFYQREGFFDRRIVRLMPYENTQ